VLGDDAVEVLRRAAAIPDAFRVDDGDGAGDAHAQAVGLGPLDAAVFGEAELLEP